MKLTQQKRSQKNKWFRLLGLFSFLLLSLVACEQDDPFEDHIANRGRYLGVWQVTENTGINHPQFYSVNISAGTQDDEIVIAGLYNEPNTRVAALVSGNSITIPNQTTDGIFFSGDGSANSDFSQILLSFTADDGSGPDVVEAVMVP